MGGKCTVLALFLSYSLVRIRCSLSASACRMVCWRRASRRFRSVNESGLETLRRGVIMGAWLSLAMVMCVLSGLAALQIGGISFGCGWSSQVRS